MKSRILIAVPGIAIAIGVVLLGGPVFAAAAALIAVVGLFELYNLTAALRPLRWAGYLGAILCVVFALVADRPEHALLLAIAVSVGLCAVAGLVVPNREDVTVRVSTTLLGALYLGLPMGILVLTRELPDGAAAVANVLVGTWVFDTASYVGGRTWGRRKIAPRTSPGKTWEGFATGVVVGTFAVWFAGLYMDWLSGWESLVIGVVICLSAFVGDLFESLLKRDAQAKDSGRLLLGHGGVLDRFDSTLFSVVAAYFTTVALVY
ncbi:MAG: phosphatidate cytidylyltransferase [Thermoleophilia bacterium]|nr:phosphatidate cytidylyltransferase [Thermoleophilia bacterium]